MPILGAGKAKIHKGIAADKKSDKDSLLLVAVLLNLLNALICLRVCGKY